MDPAYLRTGGTAVQLLCAISAAMPMDSPSLGTWLRDDARANVTDRVPTKRIYQYCPNCTRDSRDLRAALAILAERGRARME